MSHRAEEAHSREQAWSERNGRHAALNDEHVATPAAVAEAEAEAEAWTCWM